MGKSIGFVRPELEVDMIFKRADTKFRGYVDFEQFKTIPRVQKKKVKQLRRGATLGPLPGGTFSGIRKACKAGQWMGISAPGDLSLAMPSPGKRRTTSVMGNCGSSFKGVKGAE